MKSFLKGKTILVVDDVEDCFNLLDTILTFAEANTIWAKDGIEAIEICKSVTHIDLALMDIRMPKMNGYDTSRKIKEIRPDLPIIIQSAYLVDYAMEKVFEAGCQDYISKPFTKERLYGVLEKYI